MRDSRSRLGIWIEIRDSANRAQGFAIEDARLADLAWRREFPIVDTCTYLVSHSLGAMPRRAARLPRDSSPTTWDGARRARVARGLVGDRARDRRSARADSRRAAGTRSRCTRTSPSRRRSSRRASASTAARRKIVMTDLEFPSNHYLFEGFRRYGAEIVYVPSTGRDPDRSRSPARRDRRTNAAGAAVARAVQERLHRRMRAR